MSGIGVNGPTCFELRRFEKMEERLNQAERDLTAVTEKQALIKENLKEEVERVRTDLRERIDEVKDSLKENTAAVEALNKQLQNIYVTQKGANTKIGMNEKIIWAVIGLLATGALYLVQELIKGAGAG